MPNYYWDYLRKVRSVVESSTLNSEKKRFIKLVEGSYSDSSMRLKWKCELPISDFFSLIKFGDDEIPYAGNDHNSDEYTDPSPEQIEEISNFLNDLSNPTLPRKYTKVLV